MEGESTAVTRARRWLVNWTRVQRRDQNPDVTGRWSPRIFQWMELDLRDETGRTSVTPKFESPPALSRTFPADQNVDRVSKVNPSPSGALVDLAKNRTHSRSSGSPRAQ